MQFGSRHFDSSLLDHLDWPGRGMAKKETARKAKEQSAKKNATTKQNARAIFEIDFGWLRGPPIDFRAR